MAEFIGTTLVAGLTYAAFEGFTSAVDTIVRHCFGVETNDSNQEIPPSSTTLTPPENVISQQELEELLNRHYAAAQFATENNDAQTAEAEFLEITRILSRNKQDKSLLYGIVSRELGALSFLKSDYTSAISNLTTAVDIFRSFPTELGDTGHLPGALATLSQALALFSKSQPDPSDSLTRAQTYVNEALSIRSESSFPHDAAEFLTIHDPRITAIHTYTANVAVALNNFSVASQACAELRKYAEESEKISMALYSAEVFRDCGHYEEAISAVDDALAGGDNARAAIIGECISEEMGETEKRKQYEKIILKELKEEVLVASKFVRTLELNVIKSAEVGTFSIMLRLLLRNVAVMNLPKKFIVKVVYEDDGVILGNGDIINLENTVKTFPIFSPILHLKSKKVYVANVLLIHEDTIFGKHKQYFFVE
ncbi:Uncharacterized protein QTN25_000961 [Entamoeba marina]